MDRILARFDGKEKGPLFICFAALHGNEKAGIRAIDLVHKMLQVEPVSNPDFAYKGRFVGIAGNLQAIEKHTRYIEKDLNRLFTKENIERIMSSDPGLLENEDLEMRQLIDCVREEIKVYKPDKLVFLDLHTTSSKGGIFTICKDDPLSVKIAKALHAPVVLGIAENLKGTTLHYFNAINFIDATISLTFESGQHEEPLSVNRAISAIINCMKEIGSIKEDDVENFHEEILLAYSENLPRVVEIVDRHEIRPQHEFIMKPGYENFRPVRAGEVVAYDRNGPVQVRQDGLILMPLYQQKGSDGFFVVKIIEERI